MNAAASTAGIQRTLLELWRVVPWPLRTLTIVLVPAIAVVLLLGDVETELSFSTLTLTGVLELEQQSASDFMLAVEVADVEIHGRSDPSLAGATQLALSSPNSGAPTCSTLHFVPELRRGQPVLTIEVQGASGCAVSIQSNVKGRAPAPELHKGESILVRPAAGLNGAPDQSLVLFRRSQTATLAGEIDRPGVDVKSRMSCSGTHLDLLAGYDLATIPEARWLPAEEQIKAQVRIGLLRTMRVEGRNCLLSWAFAWIRANWLVPTLSAVAALLLTVFTDWLRRRAPALVLVWAAWSAGHAHAHAQSQPRRVILVGAFSDCATRAVDVELKTRVRNSMQKLSESLRNGAKGIVMDASLWNPSSTEIEHVLSLATQPVWFIYSGHGQIIAGRSVVCLSDGPTPIESLIAQVPAGKTVSFWFISCSSAFSSVPRHGTSVFSMSPRVTNSTLEGTPIGDALVRVLERRDLGAVRPDLNCDGVVTDRELFEGVRLLVPPIGRNPARPKLMPAWSEIPLFGFDPGYSSCPAVHAPDALAAQHPELAELFAAERRYRGGDALGAGPPPVLWVRPTQQLPGVSGTPRYALRGVMPDEARALARSLLWPRVWAIAQAGDRLSITDAKDESADVIDDEAIAGGAVVLGAELEQRLLTRVAPEKNAMGQRTQYYSRPPSHLERVQLQAAGFSPCGCVAPAGYCFCAGAVERGTR